MKTTKNWKTLPEQVSLTIPSTVNVDTPAARHLLEDVQSYVLGKMSQMFGGVTMVKAMGGYLTESGNLVTEEVVVATSNAMAVTSELRDAMVALAEYVKDKLTQEAVLLTINGTAHLVGIEEDGN